MVFVLGAGLTFHASAISTINHLYPCPQYADGGCVLGAVLAYLVWVTIRRRHISIKGFRLELPGLGLTARPNCPWRHRSIGGGGGIVCSCFRTTPSSIIFTFAATYVFACILGVVSNAPGGIGVFEAAMLKAVPIASEEALLASLVLFRVIYYLVPFLFALAFLGAHEIFRRWNSLREDMRRSEEETVLEDEINPLRRWYRDTWRPRQ